MKTIFTFFVIVVVGLAIAVAAAGAVWWVHYTLVQFACNYFEFSHPHMDFIVLMVTLLTTCMTLNLAGSVTTKTK